MQNLELGPFMAFRINDVPGGIGTVRIAQVAVEDIVEHVVVFVLPQILVPYAPAGVFLVCKGFKPFLLLFPADVEEEF